MSEIRRANAVFQYQPPVIFSQANPVSNTVYPVLTTTKNVRIISLNCYIVWATTQPTNMRLIVTIDGEVITFTIASPVTATDYFDLLKAGNIDADQLLGTTDYSPYRAFLREGRSVKIDIAITWATTQPTPLGCRVKWAKIP